MGSSSERAGYGTTIVTLTMNPALDITTSRHISCTSEFRGVVALDNDPRYAA
jgi:hypothetical protein